MRRLLQAALLAGLALSARSAFGMESRFGFCTKGDVTLTVPGLGSIPQQALGGYGHCLVTVYLTGTTNLATIYADNNPGSPTPLANPFYADATTGYWEFFAAAGVYDVRVSGGGNAPGISPPFAYNSLYFCDAVSGANEDTNCGGTSGANAQNVCFANIEVGTGNQDIGDKINACYAGFPANGGIIFVANTANGSAWSYSTPIVFGTMNKPVWLEGAGGRIVALAFTPSIGDGMTFNTGQAPSFSHLYASGSTGIALTISGAARGVVWGGSNGIEGGIFENFNLISNSTGAAFTVPSVNSFNSVVQNGVITQLSSTGKLVDMTAACGTERFQFVNVSFSSVTPEGAITLGTNGSCWAGDVEFSRDSLDDAQLDNEFGTVSVAKSHFENPGHSAPYDFVIQLGGSISIDTSVFANSGMASLSELVNSGGGRTTIGTNSYFGNTVVPAIIHVSGAADLFFWPPHENLGNYSRIYSGTTTGKVQINDFIGNLTIPGNFNAQGAQFRMPGGIGPNPNEFCWNDTDPGDLLPQWCLRVGGGWSTGPLQILNNSYLSGLEITNPGTTTSVEPVNGTTVTGTLTVPYSATPSIDLTGGNTVLITLTGDASPTIFGIQPGAIYKFVICQDSGGSHSWTWPANVRGGMTIGSTGLKCNVQDFTGLQTPADLLASSSGVTDE